MENFQNIINNTTNFSYLLFDQFNDPYIILSTKILFLVMFNFIFLYNWSYLGSKLLKNTMNYEGLNSVIKYFIYFMVLYNIKIFSLLTNNINLI